MGAERSSCEDCCRTKDLENGTFEVARRDTLTKEVVAKDSITSYVSDLLEQIQKELFEKHWITEIRILRK
jgi:hypothetical protein